MTHTAQQPSGPAERLVLTSLDALKVYFDPMRMRIVQEMADQPKTVHEVAEALDVPFTRLYYHINMLQKHNIIRLVEVKAMSGAVEEKYYQVSARRFVVDHALLTMVDDADEYPGLDVLLNTMLGETMTDIRASVRQHLIDLQATSPNPDALMLQRGFLRLSRQAAEAFQRELSALFSRYLEPDDTKSDDERDYALAVAFYPSALPTNLEASSEEDDL